VVQIHSPLLFTNHGSQSYGFSLTLGMAIISFLNYKTAEGLTDRSVDCYNRVLEKYVEHTGEIEVGRITQQHISDYLLYFRTEYAPQRFGGDTRVICHI
jgi:integrase/recombinase XerD